MSLKHLRNNSKKETDGSEVLGDNHHEVSRDQLVPRIVERNKQAVKTDRRHFLFFQKKQAGRRCSCFVVSSSPSGDCQICYNTGVVGGYEKFGTISEVVDVTSPNIRTVNVLPDYESQSRPTVFMLEPNALSGHLEVEVPIRPNLANSQNVDGCRLPEHVVDITQLVASSKRGTSVKAFVRTKKEATFIPLTNRSLGERLTEHSLILRVELSRTSYNREVPVFSHLMLRYKLCEELRVKADIPRQQESITLAEYGVFDSFTTLSMYLATDLSKVGTEDFFFRMEDGTFWKTIESSPNRPLGQLTSHDLVLRLVQNFEPYARFPK